MLSNSDRIGRLIKTLSGACLFLSFGVLNITFSQSANASSRHHKYSDRADTVTHHRHTLSHTEISTASTSRHHHHKEMAQTSSGSYHYRHHRHSDYDTAASVTTRHHYRSHREYIAETHSTYRSRHHHAYIAQSSSAHSHSSAQSSGNVVDVAERFNGTRYVFGGTSRSGFDCSGFTRYVLGASAGVSLPRTAMEQYENGRSISRSDLQPGDLVFFANTYRHGISHVGIYIGDGHFEHAANEREGVRVDDLNEAYYSEHYAGARRVIFDREYTER